MSNYTANDIRNIIFLGHAGAGKTSLVESILHKAGVTNRLGSVDDRSSILDNDQEEKERGHSVDSGLAHVSHKGKEINIIDTPGYPDFLGATLPTIVAAETAVIVVNAAAGIQMNTRKLFTAAKDRGMACAFVINRIDGGTDEIMNLVKNLQESFGVQCRCANLPTAGGKGVIDCIINDKGEAISDVAEAHTNLLETVIEADESLMEQYLGGETIAPDKVAATFLQAMIKQSVYPIFFTSARNEIGVDQLLDFIAQTCPSPLTGAKPIIVKGEGEAQTRTPVELSPTGDVLGLVFRMSSDPKTHIKYSAIRLLHGVVKSDTSLATSKHKGMRAGGVHKTQGDRLDNLEQGIAGDIITLAKLETQVLDTIFTGADPGHIETPVLPIPMFSLAIEPKNRGDETKISGALAEIIESDPTFKLTRDMQTHEMVVSGLGELHTRMVLARLAHRRGLELLTKPPTIPYLETITGKAEYVEYTHKKQTGGSGQFAKVFINLEPNERGVGYEFIDKIFAGVIDGPFRASVDKGIQAILPEGVVAGFPVVDVKVTLVDGKTHPVDSKDIAFQTAGREAFRKAFAMCNPVLLEPIVTLEVTVPNEFVGDITGDLSGRRGRVQGQDQLPGNLAVIKAQVPLSELQQYNSQLKSVTGGQGSFTMELSHYEPLPGNVQQQVIAKRKAAKEEDKEK